MECLSNDYSFKKKSNQIWEGPQWSRANQHSLSNLLKCLCVRRINEWPDASTHWPHPLTLLNTDRRKINPFCPPFWPCFPLHQRKNRPWSCSPVEISLFSWLNFLVPFYSNASLGVFVSNLRDSATRPWERRFINVRLRSVGPLQGVRHEIFNLCYCRYIASAEIPAPVTRLESVLCGPNWQDIQF